MSQADANVYKRRRLVALVVFVAIIATIFAGRLFANPNPTAEPEVVETASAEPTSAEVTNCQPGVVEVEAFIGRAENHEALINIPEGEPAFLWY